MPNLGNEQICVINTTKGDVLPLGNDNVKVSFDTQPTRSEFLMERAQESFCKLKTLQTGRQVSEFFLDNC